MATTNNKSTVKKASGPTKKKRTKASTGSKPAKAPTAAIDPRAAVELTPKNLVETLAAVEAVVAGLERPAEPGAGDLVDAMVHFVISAGLPCGYGQEALRRFAAEFVDRNEFRVTEAFEVQQLIADLEIPDAFERCRTIQQASNQVYADQNKVDLDHLREAAISERKNFFQRVPAIPPATVQFLNDLLAWEEIVFSTRSTQRVQQKVGLDSKRKGDEEFIHKLSALLAPFGHLPLRVGPDLADGKPRLDPPLSVACLLVRLSPRGKK